MAKKSEEMAQNPGNGPGIGFAVSLGAVTLIGPLVAPAGTVALICASLSTLKPTAAVPLMLTAVAPEKPLPVTVTTVPTGPDAGVKPEMVSDVDW